MLLALHTQAGRETKSTTYGGETTASKDRSRAHGFSLRVTPCALEHLHRLVPSSRVFPPYLCPISESMHATNCPSALEGSEVTAWAGGYDGYDQLDIFGLPMTISRLVTYFSPRTRVYVSNPKHNQFFVQTTAASARALISGQLTYLQSSSLLSRHQQTKDALSATATKTRRNPRTVKLRQTTWVCSPTFLLSMRDKCILKLSGQPRPRAASV
jgi:hypothetical protein